MWNMVFTLRENTFWLFENRMFNVSESKKDEVSDQFRILCNYLLCHVVQVECEISEVIMR
jgi:hypothetical protein